MEQLLETLASKAQLSAVDAVSLLRYIQEYASPIVHTRTSGTSDRPGSRSNSFQTKGNQKNKTPNDQKRLTSPVGAPKQSSVLEGTQSPSTTVDLNSLEQFPPPGLNALPK